MTTETKLSSSEIVRAATNSPDLSTRFARLGDRDFPIVDLPYDDYLVFLTKLQPMIMSVTSVIANRMGVPTPDLDLGTFSPNLLIQYCGKDLPELVRTVCKQTDPGITVEEIKNLGKTPFALAKVVMIQIDQNRMIPDFLDFFKQMLPLLTAGRSLMGGNETTL